MIEPIYHQVLVYLKSFHRKMLCAKFGFKIYNV